MGGGGSVLRSQNKAPSLNGGGSISPKVAEVGFSLNGVKASQELQAALTPTSKPQLLQSHSSRVYRSRKNSRASYDRTGLPIFLAKACSIPAMDLGGQCDAYVVVELVHVDGDPHDYLLGKQKKAKEAKRAIIATARSSVHAPSAFPEWSETVWLNCDPAQLDLSTVYVHFTLMDKDDYTSDDFVGHALIALDSLLRRPERELLLLNRHGNAVVAQGKPPAPTRLHVGVALKQMATPPDSWPRPSLSPHAAWQYSKHVLIMSRGTRGDVQPFVALARGMAEQNNWLVTFATELRWRDFVLSKTRGLSAGAVRFRPTGGDTSARIEGWIARLFIESKMEMLQCMMLAWSEADFFSSGPALVHIAEQLQASSTPVDLLVHSFTLTGLAMLVSERCSIPMAGFILQPSSIPSADKDWKCVGLLDGGDGALRRSLSQRLTARLGERFTSHETLQRLKAFAESNPFSSFSLPRLRSDFGLPKADTWRTLQALDVPMVIPMLPSTFKRPSDWPAHTVTTDFIFLREPKRDQQESKAPALPQEIQSFIDASRACGRPLVLMTFSSMPVQRRKMLECAQRMLEASKKSFSLIYVGKRHPDSIPKALAEATERLSAAGQLLEVASADFGVLFAQMDAFIVHGGLGTTVEALRMKKPVAVTGLLLMDQRFWGAVCHEKGVGPPPVHIDDFEKTCVEFVDRALEDGSQWLKNAEALNWGEGDGVAANVAAFKNILEEGIKPADSRVGVRQTIADSFYLRTSRESRDTRSYSRGTVFEANPAAQRFSRSDLIWVTEGMIEDASTDGQNGNTKRLLLLEQIFQVQEKLLSVDDEIESHIRKGQQLQNDQLGIEQQLKHLSTQLRAMESRVSEEEAEQAAQD